MPNNFRNLDIFADKFFLRETRILASSLWKYRDYRSFNIRPRHKVWTECSVCLQVLLRQEHHDEGARQEVRVQVRFPGTGSRDAAGGGRSGGVQIPERALHVRLRPCQAEPDAAAGGVGLGFRSRRPLSIGIELLVDEPGRQLVCRPSHGLRTRATSSRHLSALRMTRRRALGCPGHAALKPRFYRKSSRSRIRHRRRHHRRRRKRVWKRKLRTTRPLIPPPQVRTAHCFRYLHKSVHTVYLLATLSFGNGFQSDRHISNDPKWMRVTE